MMASPAIARLYDLARCLRRSLRRGWLDSATAEAVLTLAAARADVDGMDLPAVCDDLHGMLWREAPR